LAKATNCANAKKLSTSEGTAPLDSAWGSGPKTLRSTSVPQTLSLDLLVTVILYGQWRHPVK